MTRRALALLVFVPACERGVFTDLLVDVDYVGNDTVAALSGNEHPPCPALAYVTDYVATLNGDDGAIRTWGGEFSDPDGADSGDCEVVEIDFGLESLDGGTLDFRLDNGDTVVEARGDWPTEHAVWTDDDVAAAYAGGTTFTVSWTPSDSAPPDLTVYEGEIRSDDVTVEVVDQNTGAAQYRFVGTATSALPIAVVGSAILEREPSICTGVPRCRFYSAINFTLRPRE